MPKTYLEPNVINWSRRSSWSGTELRARLENRGLEPHFGIHGIYELARGFLAVDHHHEAVRHFEILEELEPVFTPTPRMLFEKELDKLNTGAEVIPVLDSLNQTSAKEQVALMARGTLEDAGRDFISKREANLNRDHPAFVAGQLEQVTRAMPSRVRRPTTFEEAFDYFDPQVPNVISQLLGTLVTGSQAIELHARLGEFPAIRSSVRANIYMVAAPLVSGTRVSKDKNDDYRHVIEAAYASVFVTGDAQLARTVPRIHPQLKVLQWRELAAR